MAPRTHLGRYLLVTPSERTLLLASSARGCASTRLAGSSSSAYLHAPVTNQEDKKKAMLEPLDDAEYAAVSVPSPDEIRRAFSRGAEVLRRATEQPRPPKVDPKIRFR